MEEQELAIRTIAQELAQLEHLVVRGELIAPENVLLLNGCIEQAIQLRNLISKTNGGLPLQNWMQKTDRRAAESGKSRRSEIVKRA